MPDVNIRFDDGGLTARLKDAPRLLHEALHLSVRDVADLIFAESQDRVPVDKGILKKSGNVRYGDLEATVGYNAPYALFVHEGTAPHVILPRSGGVLAFPPSGARGAFRGGQRVGVFRFGGRQTVVGLVFAKRVEHPGTKPNRYLADAVEAAMPRIVEIVRGWVQLALDRLEKGGGT